MSSKKKIAAPNPLLVLHLLQQKPLTDEEIDRLEAEAFWKNIHDGAPSMLDLDFKDWVEEVEYVQIFCGGARDYVAKFYNNFMWYSDVTIKRSFDHHNPFYVADYFDPYWDVDLDRDFGIDDYRDDDLSFGSIWGNDIEDYLEHLADTLADTEDFLMASLPLTGLKFWERKQVLQEYSR